MYRIKSLNIRITALSLYAIEKGRSFTLIELKVFKHTLQRVVLVYDERTAANWSTFYLTIPKSCL